MDYEDTTDQPGSEKAVPVADAVAAPAAKKTVEHWARAKGMLPEFTEGKKLPIGRPKAKAPLVHNPKFAAFHGAKNSLHWPIGMELTEAEFDQAIADVQAHTFR